MSFNVVRRATLLVPSNPQGNLSLKHLFVVMCDPNPQGDVLLVSISTYKEGRRDHDSTCLLEKGDHPFIKHTSYVQYESARQESATTLTQRVASKLYVDHGLVDTQVFRKILDGFYVSDFVKPFASEFLPEPNPFR